jgi:hypothetical protein
MKTLSIRQKRACRIVALLLFLEKGDSAKTELPFSFLKSACFFGQI